MKEKMAVRKSKSPKDEIISVAGAGSKKRRRSNSHKSRDFRSRFLQNLMLQRQEVEEALKRLRDSQKENEGLLSATSLREELDQAGREISAQTHYSIMERKNRELKKIELLIRRILEDEHFWLCEDCGKRIPEERLLIVPEATRCVPCQRDMEKWDSRESSAEVSYPFSRRRRRSGWIEREDLDDRQRFRFKPDMEHTSFMDLGETDLEEPGGENNGI